MTDTVCVCVCCRGQWLISPSALAYSERSKIQSQRSEVTWALVRLPVSLFVLRVFLQSILGHRLHRTVTNAVIPAFKHSEHLSNHIAMCTTSFWKCKNLVNPSKTCIQPKWGLAYSQMNSAKPAEVKPYKDSIYTKTDRMHFERERDCQHRLWGVHNYEWFSCVCYLQ